ncbi:RNA-binding S4 domain-containing protein [Aureimonas fodinaquatilis]|uniref:RNA-binding S4 domain-containing protein n=1 Tax=Aureimonas fodinaquatilis TaxID=2565783 RepID=A0A5B0DSB1_9HYPH|nr:RNA-binding S4 domain-containing protein [Aureimonas fodinaquatilis]KAA0968875.1 RNA-binding S4 domain-containing protein [Aureimonas fodinaquatilis]
MTQSAPLQEQRIDKWLFFARIVKSRSLAQELLSSGAVRLNRVKVQHNARVVRAGDVLTIAIANRVRVLRIAAIGIRRGPAAEAATLYFDLAGEGGSAEAVEKSIPE